MTNLPAVLSTLQSEITVLTERLKPAAEEQVSEAVRSLLAAGLSLPSSMDPEKAPAVYRYAITNVSVTGLRKAVSKLIRGEYENINKAFIPTPPELAAMARAETRPIVDDLARAKAKMESIRPPETPKVDAAAKARIRSMLKNFRAENFARKSQERGSPPHETLTPEKVDYWAKITAMPDAKEITEEQHAFRRKIEMQTETTVERKAAAE
ncbi:MAG: hypothetical protein QHC90_13260 [Shinella sp.]|nr:hypothetical protein [Shinella sp.]